MFFVCSACLAVDNLHDGGDGVEIRIVGPEDDARAEYIGRQAFAHGSRGGESWTNDPNRPAVTTLGAYDDAGLQARVSIIHYQVHLGEHVVVPMGGIGGVSCLPASRGKGYVGQLLDAALIRMREQEQVISSLFPFSVEFYRRYGWEWVGLSREYHVPTRILKASSETEKARAALPADRPKIEACYTEFARRYRGMLARDEKRWNDILKDEDEHYTYTYLYEHDGTTEGYLSFHGGTDDATRISEFIVLTPRALRGMLGLLRRHDMQTEKFTWRAPDNDLLYHTLCHNDVETKLRPTTQCRIVDVAGAFAALRPHSAIKETFTMEVSDEHAPWNAGVWQVEAADKTVSVHKTDAAPQVSLSIQTLSQMYYGTPMMDILGAGHIVVHDKEGCAGLWSLLGGPPMWTYDAF